MLLGRGTRFNCYVYVRIQQMRYNLKVSFRAAVRLLRKKSQTSCFPVCHARLITSFGKAANKCVFFMSLFSQKAIDFFSVCVQGGERLALAG